ncbi:NAD(P)-dependent oxidoreductase [Oceanospirillum sediminis]|uniref:NAD(P)-dependent oxidoreductase n=1 Tax=Oceanospirillum sediminis TaxID=2760088 RepID=A0A839ITL8_9GAMM|nr:NAD(P)-dependent oxidoreductase [Oceanospirillum sediminis]MBB1487777.1 NAD(P)-dependent oxidoreductase [Oceanospirillum sediminis]
MSNYQTAFIGLGVMGFPMAGHLQKSYPTTVYNRTSAKAQAWQQEHQGNWAETPAEAADNADIVFVCVGNDDDVRSVVYGGTGVLATMKAGSVLVDHTTTSAELAEELAEACNEKGISFIDAPVSGGQAGAENGCLTIMCGGDAEVFEKVRPVMDSYAARMELLGENGQGQRCKMINQICIAGVLQGLSEAFLLAEKSGLDITQVAETLAPGAAGSWQMVNRAPTMAERKYDFGFAIDWMRKDLGICLQEAAKHNLDLKLTQEVDKRYASLQDKGLGRMDTSVLFESVRETAEK